MTRRSGQNGSVVRKGRMWHGRYYGDVLGQEERKRLSVPLGLPKGGLHAFRHVRVSVLRTRGVPDDLVKEWVGHSSLGTTATYTHFQDDFRQQVARDLGLLSSSTEESGLTIGPNGPKFRQFGAATEAEQAAENTGLTVHRGVA